MGKMKLKPIPQDIVVHTPTEAEAKELLAILHENGYEWCGGKVISKNTRWYNYGDETCYCLECASVSFSDRRWFETNLYFILTLAEFKERYVLNEDNFAKSEQEKPQPKFKVGDIVRVINDCGCNACGLIGIVSSVATRSVDVTCDDIELSCLYEWIEPYTEPETKSTAKETKEPEETFASNELNLCELLNGHEREVFYHLMYGKVAYKGINEDGFIIFTDSAIPTIYDDGKYDQHANVVLFPSRALYEQYPLDPYTAWMKWQEEQCRYKLDISYTTITDDIADCFTRNFGDIYFLTTSDRDKCIEEIKAIIEKYNKK